MTPFPVAPPGSRCRPSSRGGRHPWGAAAAPGSIPWVILESPLAATGATTTVLNGPAPDPLPWPPMVTGPGLPANSRRHAGRPPFPVPLFRPREANPRSGTPTPLVKMPRPEIFSKKHFREITPTRVIGPRARISRKKIWWVTQPSGGDCRSFMGHPYLFPGPTPVRRFLIPRMTVSPLSSAVMFLLWRALPEN
jgi:hypothetical protein